MMKADILLVEDDNVLAKFVSALLEDDGYSVHQDSDGASGLAHALSGEFRVLVTDMKLPELSGLELVKKIHEAKPHLPVILMTAHRSADNAIRAIQSGAFDYLLKPFKSADFLDIIQKAMTSSKMANEPVEIGRADPRNDAIIGQSRPMLEIYKQIGRLAGAAIPVLIQGETGAGKELVARAIYQFSSRREKPFIAINCAAIPETLLESELFGHERGAFTGAVAQRIGRFEQAHTGTLFLDEIGDLTFNTQAKLLRVLQEGTFQRIGGQETVHADVRLITATHRDLKASMAQKLFREDLYYRLNVSSIHLPPLRERPEDIQELIQFFLHKHAARLQVPVPAIQPEAMTALIEYSWPGNVRELENVVRKLLIQARGFAIDATQARELVKTKGIGARADNRNSLGDFVSNLLNDAEQGKIEDTYALTLAEVEKELFQQAFQRSGGNQSKAARWLGLARITVREKWNQLGLRRASP